MFNTKIYNIAFWEQGTKMSEPCEKLEACMFFKTYQKEQQRAAALKGFITMYCKGTKQNEYTRKKVAKALGGGDKVPVNMMPNGMALSGTDKKAWPKEVTDII